MSYATARNPIDQPLTKRAIESDPSGRQPTSNASVIECEPSGKRRTSNAIEPKRIGKKRKIRANAANPNDQKQRSQKVDPIGRKPTMRASELSRSVQKPIRAEIEARAIVLQPRTVRHGPNRAHDPKLLKNRQNPSDPHVKSHAKKNPHRTVELANGRRKLPSQIAQRIQKTKTKRMTKTTRILERAVIADYLLEDLRNGDQVVVTMRQQDRQNKVVIRVDAHSAG
jgi:hypothetical protein